MKTTPNMPKTILLKLGLVCPLAVILTLLYANSVWAIVPEPMVLTQPEAGFSGNVYSDISKTGGNVDLLTWAVGGQLQYREMFEGSTKNTQRRYRARAEHFQGEVSGMPFANQFFGIVDSAHFFNPRFGAFTFLQLETNDFQALTRRTTAGVGAFVSLLSGESWQVWTSLSPMFEDEENIVEGTRALARGACSLSILWSSKEQKWGILNSFYWQPRLFQAEDYRALYYTEIQIAIDKNLSFHLIGQLHYDNQPPTGIKDTDSSIRNRFSYRFN